MLQQRLQRKIPLRAYVIVSVAPVIVDEYGERRAVRVRGGFAGMCFVVCVRQVFGDDATTPVAGTCVFYSLG